MTVSPAPVTSAIWSDPKIGMWIGRPVRLEQRHAAAAARDQHGRGRACVVSSSRPALSSTRGVLADRDAEQLLDLRLVRRAGGHAAEAQQGVARVDQHRRAPARAARTRCARCATSAGVTSPLP